MLLPLKRSQVPMRRVTIKDVARHLDVSVATVSLALRGDSRIAEKTRKSVRDTAKELGYTYNRQAANLRMGRSNTVAICINDLYVPIYNKVLIGVEERLNQEGWMLLLCNAREDVKRQHQFLKKVREMNAAGVLLAPVPHSTPCDIRNTLGRTPIVLFSRSLPGNDFDSVTSDDVAGIKLVIDHLHSLGHRHIGWVGSNLGSSTGKSRFEAYKLFMTAYGLDVEERRMMFIANTRSEGYEAAQKILKASPETTALACFGDPMALGALAFSRDYEREIGKKLSITGYDDGDEALFSTPRLTSVCQPKEQMGQMAADRLLEKINPTTDEKEDSVCRQIVSPTLSIRESTFPADR